jgi:glutamate 5-kinase
MTPARRRSVKGYIAANKPPGRLDRAPADCRTMTTARGIVRYSSDDLARIRGCHSEEIADRLGYAFGPVAVHRNDMILL